VIPQGSPRPADGRGYRYLDVPVESRARLAAVDALRDELGRRPPLTQGELQRLRQDFVVEYTYDSNAIEGSTLTLKETALILDGVTVGEKPVKEHLEAVGHGGKGH
jgi:Fic family protein